MILGHAGGLSLRKALPAEEAVTWVPCGWPFLMPGHPGQRCPDGYSLSLVCTVHLCSQSPPPTTTFYSCSPSRRL